MKKLLFLLVAIHCSFFTAKADEGMWTLYNLPNAVYETMRMENYELPYGALYEGDQAVKNCVVNFGGYCSGVVVSPDGLVFTNHHCGFEAIRSHSTVEHDYMLHGFISNSYEEELPNKDLFVSFMVEQKDITSLLLDSLGYEKRAEKGRGDYLVDSLENAIQKQVRAKDSTLRVEIKPFYEGNRFFLTTYRDYADVRLVFALPKSMGKFGGETDNWMWPRQTCDFSVFRIYVDPKTGGPAKYSKDNVPMHPKKWAQVSLQGYQPGSFSMTLGYPGSTSRYLSSYGILERRDAQNKPRYQTREIKQDIMIRHMRADEAVRIKYDSKYAQSSNYWKNSIGMNKSIDSIGLIQQKAAYEAKIRQWQDSTGFLKGKLDFNKLENFYKKRFNAVRAMMYFNETFGRNDEITNRALRVTRGIQVKGDKNKPKKQYIDFKDNSDTWDLNLDREVLAALMKYYREQVEEKYQPDFYQIVDSKFGGDYQQYVDYLFKKSQLMKNNKKIYVNKKNYHKDPGVSYGESLISALAEIRADLLETYDSIENQERYLCAAKLRMEEDMPNYSDANFTMRLSYGQVGEYLLAGQPSGYYTEASSIVKKMEQGEKGVIDYEAEPIMKELLSAKDFGKYTDKTTGKLHLCFLSNNDITGGNSGSPMFNGKGELIGLAFDGNWDSLSSDIFFDKQLARCIGVDIRYVLYMMEKWGKADRLIKEINAK